jgi:hypothetical protein
MKHPLALAAGIGIGDAIYQSMRHGIHEIDWVKVGFMVGFSALLFALTLKPENTKRKDDPTGRAELPESGGL